MSIYWIELPGVRLGIMARPVAMIGWSMTCALLSRGGVDVIVSALTASEAEELGLIAEAEGCARNDLLFIQFPIEDRSLPEHSAEFEQFVKKLLEHLRKERSLVIHCRAGIGRSSLIAASVLTKMGLSADQAFRLIERARGCPVPDTPEQRKWVEQHSGFSKWYGVNLAS